MTARATADLRAAQRGVALTDYLDGAGRAVAGGADPPALDGGRRQQIVDVFIAVISGAYAHLPLKRAGYANDPVQALVLLRRRCVEMTDAQFHLAMSGVVTGLRDAHTRYRGPTTRSGHVAALPFLVESYGSVEEPTYIVSKTDADPVEGSDGLRVGDEIRWWNAVPMARAVEVYADRETGGRPEARRARALESLTLRSLDYGPPPDEHWVDVGFRRADGETGEVRVPWRVVAPDVASARTVSSTAALHIAADPARQAVRHARTLLFAGKAWQQTRGRTGAGTDGDLGRRGAAPYADVVTACPLPTRAGQVGYLRLRSFDVDDDDAYLAHVARKLTRLPQRGLIIDLRGNPGGLVWAAERLLQLFTDTRKNPIAPTRFSLLATPLTREMAASAFNRLELGGWSPSLDAAVATGEPYSRPLPLTDPEWCNDQKRQRYRGPVVAVVDANTYSAGDLFAAGFVDHGIGPLVAVGDATGGGGANVWTDSQLADALAPTSAAVGALPTGAGFTLAFRRAVRSAAGDGIPIEDAGVAGIPYQMTRRDLVDNSDLVEFCAAQLEIR